MKYTGYSAFYHLFSRVHFAILVLKNFKIGLPILHMNIIDFSTGRRIVIILLAGFIYASCTSTSALRHPTTSATLWTQNSAEYKALTQSVYRAASANLELALEDSFWDAIPDRDDDSYHDLPPAIIVDVDETVLDNSAFQARMIKQNKDFDLELWNQWVMEAQADAVPGATEFLKAANGKGVSVFYLTNREAKVEEGTRENLNDLGFPLNNDEDVILSNNERKNWTSTKTERRAFVARNYRVLMVFGDDLNDFLSAKNISQNERDELVKMHKAKWGRQWFVLPNPVYGSWESALYDFDESLSADEIESLKESGLNTKQ